MAKVAISSTGNSLDSAIDPRFGRCNFLAIVDTETMDMKAIQNPAVNASGGAGIQAAQIVTTEGVSAVITGAVGPNAMAALAAAKTQVFSNAAGTVRQAVEAFKRGELSTISDPGPAFGGRPAGFGMGAGGRGARGGRGRGYGRGGRYS